MAGASCWQWSFYLGMRTGNGTGEPCGRDDMYDLDTGTVCLALLRFDYFESQSDDIHTRLRLTLSYYTHENMCL